ncbi:MAG: lactonase family protein [Planctomycetes bacterium]|nr:lactonase family protein [Planctomycetota bacterium]
MMNRWAWLAVVWMAGQLLFWGGRAMGQATGASGPAVGTDESGGSAAVRTWRVYIGTYTRGESKGIYLFEMEAASGELRPAGVAAETKNPSFLAVHPSRKFLYAVGEISDFAGKSGAISAFAVEPASGKLRLLNQQPSGGQGPCHVIVDAAGRNALAANYGSGSAAVLPIGPDGSLGKPSSVVQHEGSGPNPQRQAGPHAHSINLDPAGRYAFVPDLGLDRIFIYRFDAGAGSLARNDPPAAAVAPGAGPRHFAFHPTGGFAYVINELASTITAFVYDAHRGALKELQTIGTLPQGFTEPNTTAEVQVHPSGRFVYGSNRGLDSIAIFSVDAESGRLTAIGHESTRGKTPRNFGIDPAGKWLIAANQGSDTLAVFRIDERTGRLQPTGPTVNVPLPVCVKFVPAPR